MYFFHKDSFRQWSYRKEKEEKAAQYGCKSIVEFIFFLHKEYGVKQGAKILEVGHLYFTDLLQYYKVPGYDKIRKSKGGARVFHDLTGRRYGHLFVAERYKNMYPVQWLCLCMNCGQLVVITGDHMKRKNSPKRDCGCLTHYNRKESKNELCTI
jgi:hypothetical protein